MRDLMTALWGKWPKKLAKFIIFVMNTLVFLLFDFLDFIMCIFFRYIDRYLEGKSTACYCHSQSKNGTKVCEERNIGISNTLYGRKNVFREMGFFGISPSSSKKFRRDDLGKTIWSDCRCESCVSWMKNGSVHKLYVVVKEPIKGTLCFFFSR